MPHKKKWTLGSLLKNLFVTVPSLFSLISNIFMLIKLEARLARKSIMTIMVLAVIAFNLLITTWACILIMLYFYFVSLRWSPLFSLAILILINIILLLLVAWKIAKAKKKLLFQETCRQISRLTSGF